MVKAGQKVRFIPFWDNTNQMVTGTVVFVNQRHRMFTAQYGKLRESFKFCQIGEDVTICGK